MTILKETEYNHEILGPICFDDGKGQPILRMQDKKPFWLARPMGRLSDGIEILISGDLSGPDIDSLDRAIQAFKSLEKVEKEGRNLIHPMITDGSLPDPHFTSYEVNLYWIDCQLITTIAVFNWDGFPYVIWIATLDETNNIIDLQERYG